MVLSSEKSFDTRHFFKDGLQVPFSQSPDLAGFPCLS